MLVGDFESKQVEARTSTVDKAENVLKMLIIYWKASNQNEFVGVAKHRVYRIRRGESNYIM